MSGVLQTWQPGLVGNASNQAPHDDRHAHNAPAVIAPAMSQEQFDYDNQRQINDEVLLTPAMLAFVISDLRQRVKDLEDDNRKHSQRYSGDH